METKPFKDYVKKRFKMYASVEVGNDIITAFGDSLDELFEEIRESYSQLQEMKADNEKV